MLGNPEYSIQPELVKPKEQITTDEVLSMSPKELAGFIGNLQKDGALKDFFEKAVKSDSLLALISYWQKWLTPEQGKLFDKILEERKEHDAESSESLPLNLEKKFTPEELDLIFSHLQAIQLSFGCSGGCPKCALDAVPEVREHIPYDKLENLFKTHGKSLNQSQPILYFASEPENYRDKEKNKTYPEVHKLAEEYAGYSPYIASGQIDDKKWLAFLGDKQARVSVFGQSAREIRKIKRRIGKKNVGVKLVGEGEEHQKGIGLSYTKNSPRDGKKGIGCQHGVLLTPRGLYNVVQIPISEDYPQGQIVIPLEKFSDEPINREDQLEDILRGCVVKSESTLSPFGLDKKWPIINIIRQDGSYRIRFDEKGVVERVETVNT